MVTDNVRLVRLLGRGGMASVWVAEHLVLQTEVAVKFISPELVKKTPSMLERFKREASAAAKIKSPHVVQTFDSGVMDDGTPYIVMELLEGESLGDQLERVGTLKVEQTTAILAQVAKALAAAHELGVIHRDIKPDNIFLTYPSDELLVKVLDFGIAKQDDLSEYDSQTQTGALIGTPQYMSPEQVLNAKEVDRLADLWAVAVVAYEALTGQMPFIGDTLGLLILAINEAQFTLPSKLPEVSDEVAASGLDGWFETAFARDPTDRFSSVKQLSEAFAVAIGAAPARTLDGVSTTSPGSTNTRSAARSVATAGGLTNDKTSRSPDRVPSSPTPKLFLGALGVMLAAAAVTIGVLLSSDDDTTPAVSPPASLMASGSATATESQTSAAPAKFTSSTVTAGYVPDGREWLPSFHIRYYAGRQGLSLLGAHKACAAKSMSLCTELQWLRACGEQPAIGAIETWTLTPEGDRGFVVRGGSAGCTARKVAAPKASADRAGVCCDRAVSIIADDKDPSFLKATAAHMLRYEKVLNKNNPSMLAKYIESSVDFEGDTIDRQQFLQRIAEANKGSTSSWTVYDHCEVGRLSVGWSADCHTIRFRSGELGYVLQRFVRRGKLARVALFSEPQVYRKFAAP